MTNRVYLLAGTLLAPIAGIETGIWAEFADLSPPVLLAVTTPAMIVNLICVSRLTRRSEPIAMVLTGAAMGLLTFSLSAGTYVFLHYFSGGGFDVNDDESGGSAAVFFAVHVGVGTIVGLTIGAGVAALAHVLAARDRRASESATVREL